MSGVEPRWWWVALLAVALLGLAIVCSWIGEPLRVNGMPRVTTYARAEGPGEVRRILAGWGESGRATARRLLRLGFGEAVLTAALFAVAAAVVRCRALVPGVDGAPIDGAVAALGVVGIVLGVLAGVGGVLGRVALLAQCGHPAAPRADLVTVALWSGRFARLGYRLVALYVLVGYALLLLATG